MKRKTLSLALIAPAFALTMVADASAADTAKLAEPCAACHGKDGVSTEPDVPTISGMSVEYLSYNLGVYKKKERPCPETKTRSGPDKGKQSNMCEVANALSDADIKQVSEYFAGKKFVRAAQDFDPALAKNGKRIHEDNCEKCHANDGSDPKDDAGFLAGQYKAYLKQAFEEFRAGKRRMEQKMRPRIQKLDDAGVDALINYYASFR